MMAVEDMGTEVVEGATEEVGFNSSVFVPLQARGMSKIDSIMLLPFLSEWIKFCRA